MTQHPPDRLTDPGAQLERTSLAWSRTAFSLAACGALLVRQGLLSDIAVLFGFGFLALAASAVFWVLAAVRYTTRRVTPTHHLLVGHRAAVAAITAVAVLVACVAGTAAVLALPMG